MRIAIFSWESLHSIAVGGVAVCVTELAAALQRRGNEVHVFTRLGNSSQPWYECIDGVHYHRCPYSSHHDFVEDVVNMCRAFTESFFQTESLIGKFDVIHVHDWLTVCVLDWIKRVRSCKTVFTIHSTEYGRCGNNVFGGNSERIRYYEWLGAYCAEDVIVVSNSLKEEIKWLYNVPEDKISVIYNGVNYRRFDGWIEPAEIKRQYDIGPLDPTVLFVGRIVYQKGPDILIDAIPHILKFYPRAKFIFAGDGEMRWGMEEKARSMGIYGSTRFLGYINGSSLTNIFKSVDCVCVPSRNEPFGIVVLEAWSAGKPVVAASTGGPSEVVWHEVNGLKVYPNYDSVAWGIGRLFADFEYARWMGRNGRIAVESVFSWDMVAQETLVVYNS